MEEDKKSVRGNVDVLIDNDKIMLVKPNTVISAQYYAPQTFKNERNLVTNYFILINKEKVGSFDPDEILVISTSRGKLFINNDKGGKYKYSDFSRHYPEAVNEIFKNLDYNFNIYNMLNHIINGNYIDVYELNRIDDLIVNFKYNEKNPGKSFINLRFDDDEHFFKLFDLDENDISFLNGIFSNYYGYYEDAFYPHDFGQEDWKRGYLLQEFSEENKKRL